MAKINSSTLDTMLVRHPPAAAAPTLDSSPRALIAHPGGLLDSLIRPPLLRAHLPESSNRRRCAAFSTLSQAWISRARPRAASAALRAATSRSPHFDAMGHVRLWGVAPPAGLLGCIWSSHSDFWRNACVGVDAHSIMRGRGTELENFLYRF